MILNKDQKETLTKLLEDVQDWMVDNNHEHEPHGSILFDRISLVIEDLNS
jgi:hypothetical protein